MKPIRLILYWVSRGTDHSVDHMASKNNSFGTGEGSQVQYKTWSWNTKFLARVWLFCIRILIYLGSYSRV